MFLSAVRGSPSLPKTQISSWQTAQATHLQLLYNSCLNGQILKILPFWISSKSSDNKRITQSFIVNSSRFEGACWISQKCPKVDLKLCKHWLSLLDCGLEPPQKEGNTFKLFYGPQNSALPILWCPLLTKRWVFVKYCKHTVQ